MDRHHSLLLDRLTFVRSNVANVHYRKEAYSGCFFSPVLPSQCCGLCFTRFTGRMKKDYFPPSDEFNREEASKKLTLDMYTSDRYVTVPTVGPPSNSISQAVEASRTKGAS